MLDPGVDHNEGISVVHWGNWASDEKSVGGWSDHKTQKMFEMYPTNMRRTCCLF